jgi:ATP-dependent DNA helicase RecG
MKENDSGKQKNACFKRKDNMSESQNIEFKQSWRDEYLKWICGFANASGGKMYIGRDDNGHIVGVENHKRLMEDIPNKIHDILGLVVEVSLKKSKSLYYIKIDVPAFSVPISYKGRYYFRTGSTKRELTGSTLNDFLLKKTGRTWDEAIEARAKLSDLDEKTFEVFLESAKKSKRFPADKRLSRKDLLVKLKLLQKGKLTRAAIVLFAKEPMRFFSSMKVRIGRFGESKVDLRYQESIEGNLLHCVEETLKILDRKFLVSPVSFEGIHRIEGWQYPLPALREIILNALIHRNYMGSHVQIEVYDDHLSFWNDGFLPDELTLKILKETHSSKPRNPLIADVCFKGGYIDAWGRGIEKIESACREANLPEPLFEEHCGGMRVTLYSKRTDKTALRMKAESGGKQVGTKLALSQHQVKILYKCLAVSKITDLMTIAKRSDRTKFRQQVLNPLLNDHLIEMTIPDKPTSSKQKYRLTEKGEILLKQKNNQ